MLRVFSMFPDGVPGVGLLLLRCAAGAALLLQGIDYFVDWRELPLLGWVIALLTLVGGAALLIGYLTPFAGLVAALIFAGAAFSWWPVPNFDLFAASLTAVFATVIAAALVCLGPGAFSLDARLFGRREIVIPSSPSQQS